MEIKLFAVMYLERFWQEHLGSASAEGFYKVKNFYFIIRHRIYFKLKSGIPLLGGVGVDRRIKTNVSPK